MEKRVLKGIYFNLRDQKISSMLFSCFALSFQTLDNSHACIVFAALAEKQWMRLQHMAALAHMKLYSQWRRQETWDEIRTQIQVNSLKSYYIKHHKTTFKRISKLYRIYIYIWNYIYMNIYNIYNIIYIYHQIAVLQKQDSFHCCALLRQVAGIECHGRLTVQFVVHETPRSSAMGTMGRWGDGEMGIIHRFLVATCWKRKHQEKNTWMMLEKSLVHVGDIRCLNVFALETTWNNHVAITQLHWHCILLCVLPFLS